MCYGAHYKCIVSVLKEDMNLLLMNPASSATAERSSNTNSLYGD